jgi:hypothetical protein
MYWRPLGGVRIPRAGRRKREDIGYVERACEQIRVARKVVPRTGEEYDDVLYELRR